MFHLLVLPKDNVSLQSNVLLLVNLNEGSVRKIELASFLDKASDRISNAFRSSNVQWLMKSDLIQSHNQIVFHTYNSNKIEVMDLHSMSSYMINLPFEIESMLLPSEKKWLIRDTKGNKYILKKSTDSTPCPNILQGVDESSKDNFTVGSLFSCTNTSMNSNTLSAAVGQKIDSPNRLLATDNTYASIAVGFPDLESPNEIYCWQRPRRSSSVRDAIVTENGQIVRTVALEEVPDEILSKSERNMGIAAYLEVVDTVNDKLRYIPVPG